MTRRGNPEEEERRHTWREDIPRSRRARHRWTQSGAGSRACDRLLRAAALPVRQNHGVVASVRARRGRCRFRALVTDPPSGRCGSRLPRHNGCRFGPESASPGHGSQWSSRADARGCRPRLCLIRELHRIEAERPRQRVETRRATNAFTPRVGGWTSASGSLPRRPLARRRAARRTTP